MADWAMRVANPRSGESLYRSIVLLAIMTSEKFPDFWDVWVFSSVARTKASSVPQSTPTHHGCYRLRRSRFDFGYAPLPTWAKSITLAVFHIGMRTLPVFHS